MQHPVVVISVTRSKHKMTKATEYMSRTKIGAYFHEIRKSRKLVLVIVAIALLLDNMLLTTVGKSIILSINMS